MFSLPRSLPIADIELAAFDDVNDIKRASLQARSRLSVIRMRYCFSYNTSILAHNSIAGEKLGNAGV